MTAKKTTPTRGARKIIVYIATSADGYIARPDGDVKWLDRPAVPGHYGFASFMRSIDTVLWGRKTWDVALEMGQSGGGFGPQIRNYVFTRRPSRMSSSATVEFVNEPISRFATRLRRAPGKHIWMMGGAELIASFLDAGEIDEFMIFVIPTLIGEGIPLVAPRHRDVPLDLLFSRRYADGVVQLHYSVRRTPPRPSRRKRPKGR